MANPEATLEWPRFCYSGSPITDDKTSLTKPPVVQKKAPTQMTAPGRKRKSPTSKTTSQAVNGFKPAPKYRRTEMKTSLENKGDQTVPSINRLLASGGVGGVADLFNLRQNAQQVDHIFPTSSITPPPTPIPEFAFSNMMRKMASKYNDNEVDDVPENKPVAHQFGCFEPASSCTQNQKITGTSQNLPGFDASLAAAALGQYLPLALQNRNLNSLSRHSLSDPSSAARYPFAPFLKNLSALTTNGKAEDTLSSLLRSSTSAALINKAVDIPSFCNNSRSEEINDIRRSRLQEGVEISAPIDLSSSNTIYGGSTGNGSSLNTSRSDEEEDDENVDVLSIDPPSSPSDIEQWSVDAVCEFVSNVDSCQEYQDVFRDHSIDGSALVVLSETHMTRILGMKLGPAFRLRSAITELMNRTTSPSFCITN